MKKLSKEFLMSEGWELVLESPLFTSFKKGSISCTIGKYGQFSIIEPHWCNRDEMARAFITTNHNITEEDYHCIIKLTAINL